MKEMFKISENANPNYLALITKIGETHPIEGADRLLRTTVNGFDIVVGNNMKEGDIVVYVPVESALSEKFLSANNLYEIDEWQKNANASEIGVLYTKLNELKSEGKKDEADAVYKEIKSKVGYFTNKNRVRIINLRGCPSNGFVAGVDSLVKYNSELADSNWEELVGTYFNYVGNDEFCKKYIPTIKENDVPQNNRKGTKKAQKKLQRFDRLVPGQYEFHYDTIRLDATNMKTFIQPTDTVTITVKVHGALAEMANVLINKKLSVWEKIKKFIGFHVETTEYGNIYSSHKVIKNRYINKGEINNFYGADIWGCVNRDFGKYLSEGMTVYGEVAGYVEGSDKMIQKNHDYGCKPGCWKFMPYRITETDKYGNSREWNISEIFKWTIDLMVAHPELEDKILPIKILYHGRICDLYPDIEIDEKWYSNFLERLHNDKNFYMELKEPMCHLYEEEANAAKKALDKAIADGESKKIIAKLEKEFNKWEDMRAPREGVVIRIDNDAKAEAFKVKTNAHYGVECAQHDAGEVDIEEIS